MYNLPPVILWHVKDGHHYWPGNAVNREVKGHCEHDISMILCQMLLNTV